MDALISFARRYKDTPVDNTGLLNRYWKAFVKQFVNTPAEDICRAIWNHQIPADCGFPSIIPTVDAERDMMFPYGYGTRLRMDSTKITDAIIEEARDLIASDVIAAHAKDIQHQMIYSYLTTAHCEIGTPQLYKTGKTEAIYRYHLSLLDEHCRAWVAESQKRVPGSLRMNCPIEPPYFSKPELNAIYEWVSGGKSLPDCTETVKIYVNRQRTYIYLDVYLNLADSAKEST